MFDAEPNTSLDKRPTLLCAESLVAIQHLGYSYGRLKHLTHCKSNRSVEEQCRIQD